MTSIYAVHTNPRAGKEAAFAEWYDARHLGDIVGVPGFVSGRRYEVSLSLPSEGGCTAYRSLALYEIAGDTRAALDALTAALSAGLEMSPAMDDGRVSVVYDLVSESGGWDEAAQRSLLIAASSPRDVMGAVLDGGAGSDLPFPARAVRCYRRSSVQRESRSVTASHGLLSLVQLEDVPTSDATESLARAVHPGSPSDLLSHCVGRWMAERSR